MEKLVAMCKIFSDLNRVKILALLQREEDLCVCEICDTLELSQPLVSRLLKMMRELKLVKSEQKGKWMLYSLETNKVVEYLLLQVQGDIKKLPSLLKCSKIEQ